MNGPSAKSIPYILIIVSLALILMLIQPAIDIISQKKLGSFEYIRKGEALFEKGRYAQSIPYFEKAYESSPDNDTIKSSLVYAYSTYAKSLSAENKYDEAIECLEKAYNVSPGESTAQNLATMYSGKGLSEARKGRVSKTRAFYKKARETVSGTGTAAQNLSIILYNDAVNEYRSGREDMAILCLKESVLAHKNGKAFELLGDLYYKRAELKRARFYWYEALAIDPTNKSISEKLNKLRREMALEPSEKRASLANFEIRYKKNLPIDRQALTEILEGAYLDIGNDLGYFPKDRTKIIFYSSKDFASIFRMPYMVRAFYDGSIKMPFPETQLEEKEMVRYIYHEYTHAIVSAKTNNNAPPWFSEGIALWEEFRGERKTIENFLGKIKNMPDISIRFLEKSFKTDQITADRALCYLLSYTLVDFILNKWGMKGLQGVLKRLGDKQHIANALDDEFLMSEKEFERKWRGYALHKYFRNAVK